MEEEYIEINIEELTFITLNANLFYNDLKDEMKKGRMPQIEGSTLYTLVALSLVSLYRKSNEVAIKDELLMLYVDMVKAIITENDCSIEQLIKLIGVITNDNTRNKTNEFYRDTR